MLLLLLAHLLLPVRVTESPVVYHEPLQIADYAQERDRHAAATIIEDGLRHPARATIGWRVTSNPDDPHTATVEITRVDPVGSRVQVTAVLFLPSGQQRTFTAVDETVPRAAQRLATQIAARLPRQ